MKKEALNLLQKASLAVTVGDEEGVLARKFKKFLPAAAIVVVLVATGIVPEEAQAQNYTQHSYQQQEQVFNGVITRIDRSDLNRQIREITSEANREASARGRITRNVLGSLADGAIRHYTNSGSRKGYIARDVTRAVSNNIADTTRDNLRRSREAEIKQYAEDNGEVLVSVKIKGQDGKWHQVKNIPQPAWAMRGVESGDDAVITLRGDNITIAGQSPAAALRRGF